MDFEEWKRGLDTYRIRSRDDQEDGIEQLWRELYDAGFTPRHAALLVYMDDPPSLAPLEKGLSCVRVKTALFEKRLLQLAGKSQEGSSKTSINPGEGAPPNANYGYWLNTAARLPIESWTAKAAAVSELGDMGLSLIDKGELDAKKIENAVVAAWCATNDPLVDDAAV